MSLVVGVMGGMGPAATWDFCRRVTEATAARGDADHLRLIVDCDPSVPDRNAALAGLGPDPGAHLARMADGLERHGAHLLCMPCNAAHAFVDTAIRGRSVPFLSMIDATVDVTLEAVPGAKTVAIFATTATIDGRLYHDAFARSGVTVLEPTAEERDTVMAAVSTVKRGAPLEDARRRLIAIADAAVAAGAGALVAACTEIPLIIGRNDVSVAWIESTQALAERVVRHAYRPRD